MPPRPPAVVPRPDPTRDAPREGTLRERLAGLADPLAFLEGLFLHSPVPYAVFGVDGHCLLVNPAYRRMFGAEPPPAYDVRHDELLEALGLRSFVERAFAGEQVRAPTVWYDPRELRQVEVREARRVAIACTFFPLWDGAGGVSHVAIAYQELTAELEARERAEQAVRQRDDFLSVASHELKTPLTTLGLKLQTFLRAVRGAGGGTPGEELAARLGQDALGMHRQLQRLGALVDALMDVSRIAAGRLQLVREPVELGALAREVTARFEPELQQAGCTLELALEEDCIGRWDRVRLEQVLTNLLSNAAKYGAGSRVQVSVQRAGERARLAVRDGGIGLAPDAHERIFGRFERAVSGRSYGGLGLGLYVTRQIVEALDGRVWAEGAPGEGATFTVELPL